MTATITEPLTVGNSATIFRPLTVADRCAFETWGRDVLFDFLQQQKSITAMELTTAAVSMLGLGWNSPEVRHLACSQRGITRLLWLATRDSHGLTPEQFIDALTDEQLHEGTRLLIETASLPAGIERVDPAQQPAPPASDAEQVETFQQPE